MSKKGDDWPEGLDDALRELHDRINITNRAVDSKASDFELNELRARVVLLSAQVKQMLH